MRNDLGKLARFDAVVECEVEIVGHLDRLIARDQCRERNDAAVSCVEPESFPEFDKAGPARTAPAPELPLWCHLLSASVSISSL